MQAPRGDYLLVGTFDGETLRLTEPARMDGGGGGRSGGDSLVTPCPEPPEGWQPVDPGRATGKAFRDAMRRARATDGFGDLWIDQQIPPKQLTEWNSNDPKRFVLNIATTGDVGAMESGVREVWGGSLCVSQSPRSAAELAAIRRSLSEIPGLLTVGSNGRAGQVEVGLVLATEELQAKLDERYGEGAVRLFGQLEPIDPVREPLPEP